MKTRRSFLRGRDGTGIFPRRLATLHCLVSSRRRPCGSGPLHVRRLVLCEGARRRSCAVDITAFSRLASRLCAPAERHRPTTANSSCHAYNVPLSTLSRVSSAKWGSRKDLRRVEVMKSKRDKDLAVGPYAQYPGEMPSTIGATAVRGGGM